MGGGRSVLFARTTTLRRGRVARSARPPRRILRTCREAPSSSRVALSKARSESALRFVRALLCDRGGLLIQLLRGRLGETDTLGERPKLGIESRCGDGKDALPFRNHRIVMNVVSPRPYAWAVVV